MRLLVLFATLLAAPALVARPRIIVVTATAGYRHESIETAERVIAERAAGRAMEVVFARDAAEMSARLTPRELQSASAVFFVNTSGELPADAREALLGWVRAGGTFVGFHAAADTWHDWPEYVAMLGAEFDHHPEPFAAMIDVADRTHKTTRELPSPLVVFEEIYYFKNFSPANVRPLLVLRDAHPLAWEKTYGLGRVFYSALGHHDEIWLSEWCARQLDGVLSWAIEREKRRAVRH